MLLLTSPEIYFTCLNIFNKYIGYRYSAGGLCYLIHWLYNNTVRPPYDRTKKMKQNQLAHFRCPSVVHGRPKISHP